jgi:hypothetical protein
MGGNPCCRRALSEVALEQLGRAVGVEKARLLAGPDVTVLATAARTFGQARARAGNARDRLILLDAVCRWLEALATTAPVVVVLDDLKWADGSTLSLLTWSPGPRSRPRFASSAAIDRGS